MKKNIMVGGGGHALSILEMCDDSDFIGYADVRHIKSMSIPYLGTDKEVLSMYPPSHYNIVLGCVYNEQDVSLKLRKALLLKYAAYDSPVITSSSAIVTKNSIIDNGSVVFEQAVINRTHIGKYCVVNTGTIIEHNCNLGDNVFTGSGALICGNCTIGNNVFIGSGAIIRDGICIANNVIVGMGSIVTKSIFEAGIYYGNPVRKMRS